MPKNLAANTV